MNLVEYVEATAEARPDAPAVVDADRDRELTYAGLLAASYRTANALGELGVGEGDRVAVMLPIGAEFVLATLGTLARKATLVPINTRFRAREIAGVLENTDPEVVIADGDAVGRVLDADPAPDTEVFGLPGANDGGREVGDWPARRGAADAEFTVPPTLSSTTGFVLHTSGSTGSPKGVVHSHDNLRVFADRLITRHRTVPGETFMVMLPLYHCTGLGYIGTALKVGATLLLVDDYEPRRTLELAADHGVAYFSAVPTMFKDWLALEGFEFDRLSLSCVSTGGAGVTASIVRRAEELLGCPVLNLYGLTETFATGTCDDPTYGRKYGSVGLADDPVLEVTVVDTETGEELPRGEPGELLVTSEAMMKGYLDPERTEEAFTDGWLHTGDVAVIDEDGYVFIKDRVTYTIVTGGELVFPREIEGVIEEIEGVREAAVVGRPDDRKGEKPVAFVRRDDPGVDADGVIEYCLDQLAAYKHPREVSFVEEIPHTPTGKIDRPALEERARSGVSR